MGRNVVGSDHKSWRWTVLVALIIIPAFALSGQWGLEANVDTTAAALPSWKLATHGEIWLDEFAGVNPWLVEGRSGMASNRPPGISAVALPAYALSQPRNFTNWPATLTALFATALAMLILHRLLLRFVDAKLASGAVLILALGTTTWSVSSAELWPHGPGQLTASIALWYLAQNALTGTGLSLAAGILIRPLTATFAAVIGLREAVRCRSWKPIAAIGIPSVLAVALLLAYNLFVFGRIRLEGGYSSEFVERLGELPGFDYLANLWSALIGPQNGLFVWSPILIVLLPYALKAYAQAPTWIKSGVWAALTYVAIHLQLNRASGGMAFAYRYPLEPLVLVAPLFTLGAARLLSSGSNLARLALFVSGGVSVVANGLLALTLDCTPAAGDYVCSLL